MSISTPRDGHVVHLLQHWGDAAAPMSLRVKPTLGSGSRMALGLLVTVAAALAVYLILILWIFETPGWWFSLIFTVMVGGFALGIGMAYVEALRSGVRRERGFGEVGRDSQRGSREHRHRRLKRRGDSRRRGSSSLRTHGEGGTRCPRDRGMETTALSELSPAIAGAGGGRAREGLAC